MIDQARISFDTLPGLGLGCLTFVAVAHDFDHNVLLEALLLEVPLGLLSFVFLHELVG